MRYLNFAACAVLLSLTAAPALQGGVITFDANVALNFSNLGAGTDQNPVNALEFGSASLPGSARFAYNGTDVNGSGGLDAGDTARIVGHGLVDSFNGLGVANNSFFGQLRNVNGTVNSFGQTIFEAGDLAGGTGLLDFYVGVAPGFDVRDAATSSNGGILAATFRITSGDIRPGFDPGVSVGNNAPISSTRFNAELVYNNSGFFSTTGGQAFAPGALNALMNFTTTDRVLTTGNQSLANINGASYGSNKNFSGNGSSLDIGSGFDPVTGTFTTPPLPLDLVLSIDGNAAFAQVPEPTSVMIFGAMGVAALVSRRRMLKKS
tara:strand:+ start:3346 stop:4305 length:960 start_codon:yes stop_codon:yes gene_type:complete